MNEGRSKNATTESSNGNKDSNKDSNNTSPSSSSNMTQQQIDDEAAAEAKKKRAGPKRRKVTHGRPCQRCIKRNIGHMCHDEQKPTSSNAQSTSGSSNSGTPVPSAGLSSSPEARRTTGGGTQQQHQQIQQLQQLPANLQQMQANNINNMQLYGYNNQLAALPVTPLTFASEHMGNEFTVISDFLESLGGGGGDNQNLFCDTGAGGGGGGGPGAGIPVNTTEKFFLTAADPSDGTNEDRLTQVINAKFEAGFLKPYNYVNGYSRLQKYMDSNMSNISRQRILNVMGTFRPAFRTVAQSLTDIDLVLVEEAFERLLLDYDRVFSSMGIPACLWRRTGEIYKGNKEFAALVNVPLEMLREGRLCIYELMAEESAVNYWEKYGNIAFDAGQKAVLTSCLLKNPDPESQNVISCCFSFTIRRDKYNIPTVIVGNFLPVSLG
ncbi:hypothetical protein BG004_004833 [Podila humilis]|nr:hypothetical protein BG004_004833 [Podila humilis]